LNVDGRGRIDRHHDEGLPLLRGPELCVVVALARRAGFLVSSAWRVGVLWSFGALVL
jgi:hypothetical protein